MQPDTLLSDVVQATLTRRRRWLQAASRLLAGTAAAGLLLASSGCGFQLRRSYNMAFKTVQLTGFSASSPLAAELARALEASGVSVVDSTLSATQAASAASVPRTHVVIDGLVDRRDMVASTTTSYGQVRNMTVRTVLRFQVKRGDSSMLLPASDVSLARDLSYNEKDALAKQDESSALHLSMQSDIVNQVMRRLSAIRPDQLDTPVPAAPPAVVNAASMPAVTASAPAANSGAASMPGKPAPAR
jgi:LPS-assembly lipoprotein